MRPVLAVPALKPAVPLAFEAAAAKASMAEEPEAVGWAKAKGAGRADGAEPNAEDEAAPKEKIGWVWG